VDFFFIVNLADQFSRAKLYSNVLINKKLFQKYVIIITFYVWQDYDRHFAAKIMIKN
jgi:hypothetical protein